MEAVVSYETPCTTTRLHSIVLKNAVFFAAVALRTTNITKQNFIFWLFNDAVRNSYVRTVIWIAYVRTVVVGWLKFCFVICTEGLRKWKEISARTAGLRVEIWNQEVANIKQAFLQTYSESSAALQCSRKGVLRWSGHVARTEKARKKDRNCVRDQLERRNLYYRGKVLRRILMCSRPFFFFFLCGGGKLMFFSYFCV
jgi:hypothetical protein